MGLFGVSFEVDLQPGSGLSFATTIFVLLLVSYILVRGTVSVGDKLTPMIWPSLAFFGVAIVAILYSQTTEEADVVRITAETDRVTVEPGLSGEGQSRNDGDSFSHSSGLTHSHDGYEEHTHP